MKKYIIVAFILLAFILTTIAASATTYPCNRNNNPDDQINYSKAFDTKENAIKYLIKHGYNQTAFYARYVPDQEYIDDFTKSVCAYEKCNSNWFRYEGWLIHQNGKYYIRSEGPEPNPEYLTWDPFSSQHLIDTYNYHLWDCVKGVPSK